ncbi:cell division protein FtsW [Candidatus Curtissbacteria bacterium RIFCSPLOWO2_02_FULL_40_13b]|uniref:Probable peptidoglycan glycosyltransferase FtsW n=3 Tax=Candidatus Curtissiibacteriota TaxID=1752717 RepID=A0A1F5HSZ1_9BACT|nr:MAG: cell division protein FtsW [Candidatus Curtissbacteria bacterium RIFCSPHIGHO2_01_FULL_40_12]OGE03687.1 MAG: cell division protein FtsW [Candidatus Curtissbacteria bacterium RIFCSPHIGHO2_12_FULL_41_17]OGE07331.1 MAG: cell division protein FtsW [Candidatus Curtissbacteria bacterium RIFCSPLOWO2_02_FULL_40_13b]
MEDKELALRSQKNKLDLWFIGTAIFLVLFGLLVIYDATIITAYRDFGDKFYYFKNQLVWASVGITALICFSIIDYHKLLRISWILLLFTIFLLIIVLIPQVGTQALGARRWISIGNFNFQPSEIAKLALIFYATAILSKAEKYKVRFIDAAIVFFLPLLVIVGLILLQPDLGTALILVAILLSVYFIGKATLWHFILIVPVMIIVSIAAIIIEPYRVARLKTFLNPQHDPLGASYQINQILSAISSGGLLGVGIGASRSKFAFIPEIQSDAIFAVIVEELGFIGAIFLMSLFLFLIVRALNIAQNAKDSSGKILAMGLVSLLSVQILFNLASNVALVPLTGIPLPFISYGGSSLVVTMISIGILVNIKKQNL